MKSPRQAIPLLRCMSDLGRLEDTMYLAMFTMEEAKHTDMFRRWFDAVGLDPSSLDDLVAKQQAALGERRGIFEGPLTEVMRRLDTDRSPQAILDASIIYNQFIEGVLAVAGYQRWDETFRRVDKLPGLQAGLQGRRQGQGREQRGSRGGSAHPGIFAGCAAPDRIRRGSGGGSRTTRSAAPPAGSP